MLQLNCGENTTDIYVNNDESLKNIEAIRTTSRKNTVESSWTYKEKKGMKD